MKVLIVDISLFLGGEQKVFIDLCSSLNESKSIELAVAINTGPVLDALQALGILIYPLNMCFTPTNKRSISSKIASFFRSSTPFNQAIYDFKPDIVHAVTGEAAKMIPALSAQRLLFWQASNFRLSREEVLGIAKCSARIIVGSTALDEFLGEILPPAYCGRVRIIPNGIDTQVYKPRDKAVARKAFALPLDVPVIGLVADLIPWKRHAFFLETAKVILRQNPKVHFVIAGRSYSSDYVSYENSFREMVSAFVAPRQLHWLQTVNNMEVLLNAFDVLIHTAHGEPSGRAVCEAMSAQIPVIAFESGAIRDLITHRKDGILIRSDDANEFAREALALLANPGQAAALASGARETILKTYTKEAMCARMISEYKCAIDSEMNHNT